MGTFFVDKIAGVLLKVFATDSPLRARLSDPQPIIAGAGVQPGLQVLEIGYGRGFFSVPVAETLGPQGCLYALDVTDVAVGYVTGKLQDAGLANTHFIKASATETSLPDAAVDLVLIFGVIPSPTLPLSRLLPEMQRVLRPGGRLAVWTAVPFWSPRVMLQDGLFVYLGKTNNVHNFQILPVNEI
jgi:ubiquinone/menaquinone biosynthesis C-methylase UbiE